MLAILFPHLFEDVEYLIPQEDLMEVDPKPPQAPRASSQVNALAGPSRLR